MKNLKLMVKAWPVITAVTIGLCYLTQYAAKALFGLDLPEQAALAPLKRMLQEAFLDFAHFKAATLNLLFILAFAPLFEEFVFRFLLFRLPNRLLSRAIFGTAALATFSSALFSAAHYIQMPWPNNAFLALFFFGLAQCWLYTKTTWFWSPVFNHFLFNLTNLILLFVIPATPAQ